MPSSSNNARLATGLRLFQARDFASALAEIDGLATGADAGAPNEVRVLRAACLARLGRPEEALAVVDVAESNETKDWFAVYLSGAIHLINGDAEGARDRFREALKRFPVAGELWYHIGLAELLAGEEGAARRAFERVAGLDELVFASRLKRVLEAAK